MVELVKAGARVAGSAGRPGRRTNGRGGSLALYRQVRGACAIGHLGERLVRRSGTLLSVS